MYNMILNAGYLHVCFASLVVEMSKYKVQHKWQHKLSDTDENSLLDCFVKSDMLQKLFLKPALVENRSTTAL